MTLEAWVKPNVASQGGPARIVSISNGSLLRNLTLGHGEPNGSAVTQYDVRLRSTTTDNNGKPSLTSTSGTATTNLTHLVYVRGADGTARLYVNGVQNVSTTRRRQSEQLGRTYKLILGNESDGSRPWVGELHKVAIYACGVSAAEVTTLKKQPVHGGSPAAKATPTHTPAAQPTATRTTTAQVTPTNTPPTQATPTVTPTNTPVSGGCGVPSGNLVSNGDFAAGTTGWRFYSNGSASFSAVSRPCGQAAQVSISSTGSNPSASSGQVSNSTSPASACKPVSSMCCASTPSPTTART